MSEIKYALMEANGTVSILPFETERPLKVKDMKVKPKKEGLCANVIIDGKIMSHNLENFHKTDRMVKKRVKSKRI